MRPIEFESRSCASSRRLLVDPPSELRRREPTVGQRIVSVRPPPASIDRARATRLRAPSLLQMARLQRPRCGRGGRAGGELNASSASLARNTAAGSSACTFRGAEPAWATRPRGSGLYGAQRMSPRSQLTRRSKLLHTSFNPSRGARSRGAAARGVGVPFGPALAIISRRPRESYTHAGGQARVDRPGALIEAMTWGHNDVSDGPKHPDLIQQH